MKGQQPAAARDNIKLKNGFQGKCGGTKPDSERRGMVGDGL
jgi:hypothetical protein